MFTLSKTLGAVALLLGGLGLQAEDFSSLMQVTKTIWPEKTHLGVICDYRFSRAQVEDLARAAGPEATLTIADIRSTDQAQRGAQMLASHQAHFLVLLPKDRMAGDGSIGATVAIHSLAQRGIPAVGTTPKSLAQGAVFCLGEGTNGEVLVTDQNIGTVTVNLPAGITYSRKASLPLFEGLARIVVLGTPESSLR